MIFYYNGATLHQQLGQDNHQQSCNMIHFTYNMPKRNNTAEKAGIKPM